MYYDIIWITNIMMLLGCLQTYEHGFIINPKSLRSYLSENIIP